MEEWISSDPTKFFDHVSFLNKSHQDLPNEMEFESVKVNKRSDIANSFAKFFATAYTQPNADAIKQFDDGNEYIDKIRNLCDHIPKITITEELVAQKIRELPNNLVAGPDGIPNLFIKNCMDSLVKPITLLLKTSLETAQVPAEWKKSYLRPIFKSGPKHMINNYRGVALQSIIAKILDSIVTDHLNFHMKSIIDESQHGFVKGKSTVTNLLEFTSSTLNHMDSNTQTDAIYLDVAKAFDSVNIELLLHKLSIMGLNNQILDWIREYLRERQQIVKLDNEKSSPIDVTSGTGQGYPIGPTLFLLMVIELPHCVLNSMVSSFADDVRLWMHVTNQDDCVTLQEDLNRITQFYQRNQLKLNVKKTKMMRFHRFGGILDFNYKIGDEVIARTNQIKDLGILLDESLNFKSHIELITGKARSRLAWIKRFAYEFVDPWTIKKLFFTFVLPILEYGSQVWNPHYRQEQIRIESVQKQFLIYALRKWPWTRDHSFVLPRYENRLLLLQMLTLEERRKLAQIVFVLKVIFGFITSNFILSKIRFRVPNHFTRNYRFLEIPIEILNYRSFEPIRYMLSSFNDLANVSMPNSATFLIDFNMSIRALKLRVEDFWKSNRNFL